MQTYYKDISDIEPDEPLKHLLKIRPQKLVHLVVVVNLSETVPSVIPVGDNNSFRVLNTQKEWDITYQRWDPR